MLTVDPRGKVSRVQVVKKAGNGFDEIATKYFKRWTFKAATKNCVASTSTIRFTYQFTLEDF